VVASPIGDIKTIVETHRCGLLSSDAAFADSLRTLLDNPALGEEMGRAGRRGAETAFAWPKLIEKLEGFYQMVLAKRAAGEPAWH
jgi:glycosyltransferase involved in cell wall biosynthesis